MKLLLVDDEEYSRNGILSIVDWESLGITNIKTAANGSEGLRTALSFRPDIILADVRMPHMDGVTMCYRIREALPACCFIFISGFTDKEYLKSAIHLSAVDYLEKPFLPGELIASLKQAVSRCSSLSSLSSVSQPAFQNEITCALMRRRGENDPLWGRIFAAYPSLPADRSWFTLLLPFWDREGNDCSVDARFQTELFLILKKHFPESVPGSVLLGMKLDNMLAAHISVTGNTDIRLRAGSLSRELEKFFGSEYQYNLCAGNPVASLYQIHSSYEAAMLCLQQSFFSGPSSLLFFENESAPRVWQFSEDTVNEFSQLLRQNQADEAAAFISVLCRRISGYPFTLISAVKDFFSRLLRKLYYYSDSFFLTSFSRQETLADAINCIWHARYLQNIEQYMTEKIRLLFSEISKISYEPLENPLPYRIKSYIDANYCCSELCLQSMSEYFSVTPSYLCIVFKKMYQTTINQYLNDRRIEKALDYLENSDKKVKEISALIGYPDPNYFIKVFKKSVGVTPKEYRRT